MLSVHRPELISVSPTGLLASLRAFNIHGWKRPWGPFSPVLHFKRTTEEGDGSEETTLLSKVLIEDNNQSMNLVSQWKSI